MNNGVDVVVELFLHRIKDILRCKPYEDQCGWIVEDLRNLILFLRERFQDWPWTWTWAL
jgi:bacterioferritin-associated ferredoxin